MLGAIIGDVIGSVFEHNNIKSKDFDLFSEYSHFTDDTVCTVAIAHGLLDEKRDFADYLGKYALSYPNRGYGERFRDWAKSWERNPYNSWGNGSAMRVSPVAFVSDSVDEALQLAKQSAEVTHNHPEGIMGAQAVTLSIWLAINGAQLNQIMSEVENLFGYDLSKSVDEIRPSYQFDVSCAGSVPQAITCALEAKDFEDAIRNAISIGGDSDTIACIAGSIAEPLFGVPNEMHCKLTLCSQR